MDLIKLRTLSEVERLLSSDKPRYSIMRLDDGCWFKSSSGHNYKLYGLRSALLRRPFCRTIYIYGNRNEENDQTVNLIEEFTREYLNELGQRGAVVVENCLS